MFRRFLVTVPLVRPLDFLGWNIPTNDGIRDTVYYHVRDEITAEQVRRALIDHDGYPPDIIVTEQYGD